MRKKATTLNALILTSLLTAPTLAAEPQTPQPPSSRSPDAVLKADAVSDAEVQDFAEVQRAVGKIQQNYAHKLRQLKDAPKQAMAVQKEAQKKMRDAVESSDLPVEKYNQMALLARRDAAFRQRILDAM